MPMELSISAGEKTGTPRRAAVARIEFGSGKREPRKPRYSRDDRPTGEVLGDPADHPVGLLELELVHVRVVDPVEVELSQAEVVRVRASHPVTAPDRLVEVLVEHRSRGDHHVDDPPVDEVAQDLAEARGDERSGEAQEDRRPLGVPKCVLPDLEAAAQVARLDRGGLELFQQAAEPSGAGDVHGVDGLLQVLAAALRYRGRHERPNPARHLNALCSNEVLLSRRLGEG